MVVVSLLIRTIGRQEALKAALESVRKQLFRDFEVVIVEDGAGSLREFLTQYCDLPIRYEHMGARQGRMVVGNRALAMAQGEYCLFLDDDDEIYPEHLQLLMAAVRQGNHRIAYSWAERRWVDRDDTGRILRQSRFKRYMREPFSLLRLIHGNFITINSVLFHRSLYEAAGGFSLEPAYLEDWLLWLRFAAIEPEWRVVKKATAINYELCEKRQSRERKKAFLACHAAIRNHLQTVPVHWPMALIQDDLKRHFALALFLRKLYYHITSYIPR
jgi:glycosyltransferase involved in cell wall biosynthesis